MEFWTLKWFDKDIGPHFLCWTILEISFARGVMVLNIEILGFDMFCSLGAGGVTMLCKGKSTHIVLKDNIGWNGIALSFEEMPCPKNVTRFVVQTDDFSFGGTFRRNFCFIDELVRAPSCQEWGNCLCDLYNHHEFGVMRQHTRWLWRWNLQREREEDNASCEDM